MRRRICSALHTFYVRAPRWGLAGTSALLLSRSAEAAVFQVGPSRTYATPSAVAPLLSPGDVVEVDGNATYPGGIRFDRPGTAGAKITVRGIPVDGKLPVIAGGINTVEVQGDHYVIENIEIRGGSARCYYHHSHDATLRGVVVHDCPAQGILGADSGSGSLTLQYVEVYRTGSGDKKHQIYMATDEASHPGSVFRMERCYVHDGAGGNNVKSRAERNEIVDNWIEGAKYRELELIAPEGSHDGPPEDGDVVGNVLISDRGTHLARLGSDSRGSGSNGRYRFLNNTLLVGPQSGSAIQLYGMVQSVEFQNNVIYRLSGGAPRLFDDAEAEWTLGTPVLGGTSNWLPFGTAVPTGFTGSLFGADPGFVDVAARNLQLSPNSPLIGRGSPSGWSSRPTADLGAFVHDG